MSCKAVLWMRPQPVGLGNTLSVTRHVDLLLVKGLTPKMSSPSLVSLKSKFSFLNQNQ